MAREKDGYRDALERIRSQASGELVTVKEAARIVYGDDTYASVRCIIRKSRTTETLDLFLLLFLGPAISHHPDHIAQHCFVIFGKLFIFTVKSNIHIVQDVVGRHFCLRFLAFSCPFQTFAVNAQRLCQLY